MILSAALLTTGIACAKPALGIDPALTAVIASPTRTAAFSARDAVRHPAEELSFFGLKPTMTVVELWPGGGYWTEILGAYLAPKGRYYVALPPSGNKEEDEGVARWRTRIAAQADHLATSTRPRSVPATTRSRRRGLPISC